jgi:hypothetical protein
MVNCKLLLCPEDEKDLTNLRGVTWMKKIKQQNLTDNFLLLADVITTT